MFRAAILPVLGQFATLFGRRHLTLLLLVVYILGSGLAGGAVNEVRTTEYDTKCGTEPVLGDASGRPGSNGCRGVRSPDDD